MFYWFLSIDFSDTMMKRAEQSRFPASVWIAQIFEFILRQGFVLSVWCILLFGSLLIFKWFFYLEGLFFHDFLDICFLSNHFHHSS
jgi:hypothetical protein